MVVVIVSIRKLSEQLATITCHSFSLEQATMSFICIVCREILSKKPWSDVDDSLGAIGPQLHVHVDIVSTKCGHMYHLDCLKDWFNKQTNPRQECPYCKSVVMTDDYQRIFPIGDEETDDIDARIKNANKMVQESLIIKSENGQIKIRLEEIGEILDHQTLAADILQYEYREKSLEADVFNIEVQEANKVLESNERKWIETLSKSENDKVGLKVEVAEEREKFLRIQAERDHLLANKNGVDNGPTTLMRNLSLNHESLRDEIRVLRENVETGLMHGNGILKSGHSMATQTDSYLVTTANKLVALLSRLEMHDVCSQFLQSEKRILESYINSAVEGKQLNILKSTALKDCTAVGVTNPKNGSAIKYSQELLGFTNKAPAAKITAKCAEPVDVTMTMPRSVPTSQANVHGIMPGLSLPNPNRDINRISSTIPNSVRVSDGSEEVGFQNN